jgi:hypothetical protein
MGTPEEPFVFPLPPDDPFSFLNELSPAAREAFRIRFTAELDEAIAEAKRDGCFTLDDVRAQCDAIVAAAKRSRRK